MEVKRVIILVPKIIISLIVFVVSCGLIFLAAYFFGWIILNNPLGGNDASFALSQAQWLSRFYPHLPFWYPVQGAGISILGGYPVFFHICSIVLSRIMSFTLTQSFGILQFSSILLTSIGINLFVWLRFKNQIIAIIASLLYFLSSMTYVWIIGAGFFAQTFSFTFVPFSLLFFDLYLEKVILDKKDFARKIYFILAAVLVGLTTLSHPVTGIGSFQVFGVYTFFYGLLRKDTQKTRLLVFKRMLISYFSFVLVSLALISFWLFPFQRYTGATGRGFNPGDKADMSIVAHFTVEGTLGLPSTSEGYEYFNFYLSPTVWGLAILAGIFGFFYSRKVFSLFIVSGLVLVQSGTWGFYQFMYPFIHELAAYFTPRYYTAYTLVLFPILAAWGVWALGKTLLLIPKLITDKLINTKIIKVPLYFIGKVIVTAASIALVIFVVYRFRNIYDDSTDFHYGPERGGYGVRTGTPLNNIWFMNECNPSISDMKLCRFGTNPTLLDQLNPKLWPKYDVSKVESNMEKTDYKNSLLAQLPNDPTLRIDITPNLGSQIKEWPLYSDISLVNTYNFQSSLIHPMWGYLQGVFYSKVDIYSDPILVDELGKYFGIDYLFINIGIDPVEKFDQAGWITTFKGAENETIFNVEKPDYPATGLYSAITQPKILVIGRLKNGAYEQLFRLANLGGLSYDQAFLVEGEESRVDKYDLSTLKEFDLVILHGYSYKNKDYAFSILSQYVQEGGSLFVDNGWQFIDADWGKGPDQNGKYLPSSLKDPYPLTQTSWQEIGPTWNGFKLDTSIVGNIDLNKVDKPEYLDRGWTGSIGTTNYLTSGAKPVLYSTDGRVVISAREYGNGRVILSGLNMPAYAYGKKGEETIKLFNGLITWLLPKGKTIINEEKEGEYYSYTRRSPDEAEFTFKKGFNNIGFTFRESYYKGWNAYLVTATGRKEKLDIYRSGPGFMYTFVSSISPGETIKFEYRPVFSDILGKVISITTVILFISYLFGLNDKVLDKIIPKAKGSVKLKERVGRILADNEDNY